VGKNSAISWCTHTFNPWIGCTKVSPACDFCYAETLMDHRYHRVQWGPHGERKRTSHGNWRQPERWARAAREAYAAGETMRHTVFCASLADWLDNQVPRQWRNELGTLIGATPELDWLLLTKRPENYQRLAPWEPDKPPANVCLGVSTENQEMFDHRWPIISKFPAKMHFISAEPLLGPIDMRGRPKPDWVITGGESGPKRRVLDIENVRLLRDQVLPHNIAFHHKQNGGHRGTEAGCLVDGVEWKQFPPQLMAA